ncbi:MAG: hypothetical protein HFH82_06670 [Lachnospiraceae bacterium]|nr:hypothetical protein [Lachnospiraceae bacterium]
MIKMIIGDPSVMQQVGMKKYKAGGFIELICGKRSIQPELKVLFMEEKSWFIK